MFFVILLVVCAILAVLVYKKNDKDYWKKRNVTQVENILKKFSSGKRSFAEVHKEVYDNHPNVDYIGTTVGSKPVLILRNLKNVQAVLASDFESFYSRGIPTNKSDLLADNVLFIGEYLRWKLIRQKLTPIFTSAKLKNMSYIIERTAHDFVEMVKEHKEMRDIPFRALYTYTTASLGASVFGIDTQMKSTMDSPFLEMSWKTLSPSFATNIKFAISSMFPTLYRLLKIKIFGEHEDFFIGVVKNVLSSRRNDKRVMHDFIDMCLELQKAGTMKDHSTGYELEPTDELLAAQAFFFFLAGADTSATTMHFTLLELAGHPDVLKRLHEEIDNVFQDHNNKVTYDAIDSLKYLDMVINEAIRKYPPVGLINRECTKDTVLPAGNLKIEKGIVVTVPIFAIHRDEKYFPNPDVFDPERFATENSALLPKYAHLAFGEGKRICLGERFAMLQVKAGLAFLLRTFTLRHQVYRPTHFEKSFFALRDPDAKYHLALRDS